jgi:hypothetical protein
MRLHSRWMSIIEAPLVAMLAGYGSHSRPRGRGERVRESEVRVAEGRVAVSARSVTKGAGWRMQAQSVDDGRVAAAWRRCCSLRRRLSPARRSTRQGLADIYLWP